MEIRKGTLKDLEAIAAVEARFLCNGSLCVDLNIRQP